MSGEMNPIFRNLRQTVTLRRASILICPGYNEQILVKIQRIRILNVKLRSSGLTNMNQVKGVGIPESLYQALESITAVIRNHVGLEPIQKGLGQLKVSSRPVTNLGNDFGTEPTEVGIKVIVEDVVLAITAEDVIATGAHSKSGKERLVVVSLSAGRTSTQRL